MSTICLPESVVITALLLIFGAGTIEAVRRVDADVRGMTTGDRDDRDGDDRADGQPPREPPRERP